MNIHDGDPVGLAQIALDHEVYHNYNWLLRPMLQRIVDGKDTGTILLACMEGSIVGIILAENRSGHIMFYVRPAYRNRGIARELFDELRQEIPDFDVTSWRGIAHDTDSFRFFNRLGIVTLNHEPWETQLWYLLSEKSALTGEFNRHYDGHSFYVAQTPTRGLVERRRHLLLKYGKPFTETVINDRAVSYVGPLTTEEAIQQEWRVKTKEKILAILDKGRSTGVSDSVAELTVLANGQAKSVNYNDSKEVA